MQPGFIEAATTKEVAARKEFWTEQLQKAGLEDKYHVVAHQMPGISPRLHLGIFVEEKSESAAEEEDG